MPIAFIIGAFRMLLIGCVFRQDHRTWQAVNLGLIPLQNFSFFRDQPEIYSLLCCYQYRTPGCPYDLDTATRHPRFNAPVNHYKGGKGALQRRTIAALKPLTRQGQLSDRMSKSNSSPSLFKSKHHPRLLSSMNSRVSAL